jgi:hypothetical protein
MPLILPLGSFLPCASSLPRHEGTSKGVCFQQADVAPVVNVLASKCVVTSRTADSYHHAHDGAC